MSDLRVLCLACEHLCQFKGHLLFETQLGVVEAIRDQANFAELVDYANQILYCVPKLQLPCDHPYLPCKLANSKLLFVRLWQ